jgi:hypothetical protein
MEILAFEDLLMLQRFDQPFPTWSTTRPVEAPLLTGWVGGPRAARLARSRNALFDLALRSLAGALGVRRANLEPQLTGWLCTTGVPILLPGARTATC